MTLGSFARGALAEVDVPDVERMLGLDETLFVEHKRDIGGGGVQLAKAAAAFANTLGGWLLVGVTGAKPYGSQEPWAQDDGPNLVDVVRNALRGVLDPLPPFEARVYRLGAGPIGVIRVYESADAPHVNLQTGAVYVREPAGDTNAADPGKTGQGSKAERIYEAKVIRSQAQLLAIADRSRRAYERVESLIGTRLPLIELGLSPSPATAPSSGQADDAKPGTVRVRLVPYSPPPRFRGWSTTVDAAAVLLDTAQEFARMRGFTSDWVDPHPAGMSIRMGPGAVERRHRDGTGQPLDAEIRLVIDGAGVVGASLQLDAPKLVARAWMTVDDVARDLIEPTIRAVAGLLRAGEFLGRARCQIDLERLGNALMLEHTSGESVPWVPVTTDLDIPADDADLARAAKLAAYAFGRALGGGFFDAPRGVH